MNADNLRLSAPDWCFYRDGGDPAAYYRALREAGYAAVEMVPAERRRAARAAGLQVLNYSAPGMEQGMNRRENHPALTGEILRLVDELAAESIPHLIVFSGSAAGQSVEEGLDSCTEGFGKILSAIRGSGVTLLFEMLNCRDHPDYQGEHEDYGLALASRLNSPNFRLLYDIYHLHRSGDRYMENFQEKMKYIAHFHLADVGGRGMPAAGQEIDYPAFFRAVPGDYAGYVGMEFVTAAPLAEAAAAAQWLRAALKDEQN